MMLQNQSSVDAEDDAKRVSLEIGGIAAALW